MIPKDDAYICLCLKIIDGGFLGKLWALKNGWREDERNMHVIREYGEFIEAVNEEEIGASITKP